MTTVMSDNDRIAKPSRAALIARSGPGSSSPMRVWWLRRRPRPLRAGIPARCSTDLRHRSHRRVQCTQKKIAGQATVHNLSRSECGSRPNRHCEYPGQYLEPRGVSLGDKEGHADRQHRDPKDGGTCRPRSFAQAWRLSHVIREGVFGSPAVIWLRGRAGRSGSCGLRRQKAPADCRQL
jgi:hypothetical protein